MDRFEKLVRMERARQDAKWGEQNHPNGSGGVARENLANIAKDTCDRKQAEGKLTWVDILREECYEAMAEENEDHLIEELIQVAAVCKQWIDCIERRRKNGG